MSVPYIGPYSPDVYAQMDAATGEGTASNVIGSLSGLATSIVGALQASGVAGQAAQNVSLGLPPNYVGPTSYAQAQGVNFGWFVVIAGAALLAIVLLRKG